MISILIPVYNIDCTPLIANLHPQLIRQQVPFEIICIDDASSQFVSENKKITEKYADIQFIVLKNNIGRSRIRNLLASKAKYPWILFLDADTLPVSKHFISTYMKHSKTAVEKVIAGGLAYRPEDHNSNNSLRYKYGLSRESHTAPERTKNPYRSLLFSNTLIQKSVFNEVHFNESITQYGHEDSLFSAELRKKNIVVKHIDNPVYHTGIENNIIFLDKTKNGIENLRNLFLQGLIKSEDNKLLKNFVRLKKNGLLAVFTFFYRLFNPILEKNLVSGKPSLFLFDLYKLGYLCRLSQKKKLR